MEEKISIYLKYEYLDIKDYSEILASIDGIYKGVLKLVVYENLNYRKSYNYITYPIPLCLVNSQTGSSIKFDIAFSEKYLPKLNVDKDTVEVKLPKWSLALVLTGYILTFGLENLKNWEELKNKKIDSQIKELQYEKLLDEKNETVRLEIEESLMRYNKIISKDTILKNTINGIEKK